MKSPCRSFATAAIVALVASPAAAGPYTANYIFGDSLSDTGNLAEALGHNFPNPPFYNDSFTNGPPAVSILSQGLGLAANPSLFVTGFVDAHGLGLPTGGTNYAVAGATAGNKILAGTTTTEGVPGANLPQQVGAFLAHSGSVASASALYTVFIGGNDVRTAAHQGDASFVTTGEATEIASIKALMAAGAKNFLVVNVPDVGLIPEFTQESPAGQAAAAHADSIAYDQMLNSDVTTLIASNPNDSFKLFDLYSANNAFIANAASFGITNTTDPCYTNTSAGVASASAPATASAACGGINPATGQATNINQFLYWDHIHPSAKVQAAFGAELLATVVPEPASFAVLGIGMAGLLAARRRRG